MLYFQKLPYFLKSAKTKLGMKDKRDKNTKKVQ